MLCPGPVVPQERVARNLLLSAMGSAGLTVPLSSSAVDIQHATTAMATMRNTFLDHSGPGPFALLHDRESPPDAAQQRPNADSRQQFLTDEQNGCYRNTFYGVQTTSATKSRNEGFAAPRSRFHPSGSRQFPRLWNAVWRCWKATGTAASQRTPPVADRHNERSPRVQDLGASIGIQSTMLMNPLTNFAN